MGSSPEIISASELNRKFDAISNGFILNNNGFTLIDTVDTADKEEKPDKNWKPKELKDILFGLEKAKEPKEKVKENLKKSELPKLQPGSFMTAAWTISEPMMFYGDGTYRTSGGAGGRGFTRTISS